MATVNLSADRKQTIRNHIISTLAEKDLKVEVPEWIETSTVDASELINLLQMHPHYDLVKTVPKSWLDRIEDSQLCVAVVSTMHMDDHSEQVAIRQSLLRQWMRVDQAKYIKLNSCNKLGYNDIVAPTVSTYVHFPNSAAAYYRPNRRSIYSQIAIAATPELLKELDAKFPGLKGMQELMAAIESRQKVLDHFAKWRQVADQIETLLNQCTTVNQALKAMPALKFYLPDDILRKVEKQVQKSDRREIDTSSLDLDTLTATGVTVALSHTKDKE